jgi:hypothetical protein
MIEKDKRDLAAQRLRSRNLAVLALLLGFAVLVFAISIIKMHP